MTTTTTTSTEIRLAFSWWLVLSVFFYNTDGGLSAQHTNSLWCLLFVYVMCVIHIYRNSSILFTTLFFTTHIFLYYYHHHIESKPLTLCLTMPCMCINNFIITIFMKYSIYLVVVEFSLKIDGWHERYTCREKMKTHNSIDDATVVVVVVDILATTAVEHNMKITDKHASWTAQRASGICTYKE